MNQARQILNARIGAAVANLEALLAEAMQPLVQEEVTELSGKFRVAAMVTQDGGLYTLTADNEYEEHEIQNDDEFACWLTGWDEYTIEKNQE